MQFFIQALVVDYATTHAESFEPIPLNGHAMVEHWQAGQSSEDRQRQPLEGEWLPLLALEGRTLARSLEEHRTRDADILEPALIAAMDDYQWHFTQGSQLLSFARAGLADDDGNAQVHALKTIVQGAQNVYALLLKQDGVNEIILPELTGRAAAETSGHAKRRAPALARPNNRPPRPKA